MVFKSKKLVSFLAVAVLLAASVYRYATTRSVTPQYELVTAQRGDIVQAVAVTGRVKPTHALALAFERSGKAAAVNVAVGDRVAAGQVLVSLGSAELAAQLEEARARVTSALAQVLQYQAALEAQQAKLDELKLGTRPEELQVKAAELEKARQGLANAYGDVPNALRSISTTADDAVRVKTASIYQAQTPATYQLTFVSCDQQAESDATWLRYLSEQELKNWQPMLAALSVAAPRADLDAALASAVGHLSLLQRFLDRTADVLTLECALLDATLDGYRTNVNAARTAVASLQANIGDLQQAIAAEQRNVQRVERELELLAAGSTAQQLAAAAAAVKQAEANLAAQRAQVQQAQAGAANMLAQLGKTVLRSPIPGVVTAVDAEVGEIVNAGATVISVISDTGYEIEANVPEADVAKIKVGDMAELTLDAYGSDVTFHAAVTSIDPAETVVEGVPTYRVKLQFTEHDERVKSGMTANLDIRTAERRGVIVIPQRAVISRDGGKVVRVLKPQSSSTGGNPAVVDVSVVTGLRGSDGNIEVFSGLSEGDRVVLSEAGK